MTASATLLTPTLPSLCLRATAQRVRRSLLSAIAVCTLALCLPAFLGCTPAQKQTTLQVITAIDAKMPEVTAAADTVAATISALAPTYAALIAPADVAFDALSKTLQALCASYIANPNATTLQQIQAAINTLESNVNTSVLAAARIKDSTSQQLAIAALKALLTVVTIIFAMISPTENTAMLMELRKTDTIHLARVRPYMDDGRLRVFAAEQGIDLDNTFATAEAAGF